MKLICFSHCVECCFFINFFFFLRKRRCIITRALKNDLERWKRRKKKKPSAPGASSNSRGRQSIFPLNFARGHKVIVPKVDVNRKVSERRNFSFNENSLDEDNYKFSGRINAPRIWWLLKFTFRGYVCEKLAQWRQSNCFGTKLRMQ